MLFLSHQAHLYQHSSLLVAFPTAAKGVKLRLIICVRWNSWRRVRWRRRHGRRRGVWPRGYRGACAWLATTGLLLLLLLMCDVTNGSVIDR